MTQEEQDRLCDKVARILIKRYKANKNAKRIPIYESFYMFPSKSGENSVVFDWQEKSEINFGNIGMSGLFLVTCKVADIVKRNLLLPKRALRHTVEDTMYAPGYLYRKDRFVKSIIILTPCKEFIAINRKLSSLGCPEIPFYDWWYSDVFGKRSIYELCGKRFYAEDETVCKRVLDYLKGKRKVFYKTVRDEDMGDREYGEKYETEWSGHVWIRLRFTDSQGKTVTI